MDEAIPRKPRQTIRRQWSYIAGERRNGSIAPRGKGFARGERDIKKGGSLLREKPKVERYRFIKAASIKGLRVARLCSAVGVTTSAYYAWDKRPESKRSKRRKELADLVREEYFSNHRIPGATKIAKKLSRQGKTVGRRTVADIMRENGWKSKVVKKYKATTNSNHNLPVAENLLNQEFNAVKSNEKWVSDITYIPTDEGWLYLAGILDLCDKEVVGWAMGDRMTKGLVINALNQANMRRNKPEGVLIHSDRGSQYCSHDYQNLLKKGGYICSMSRKGNCWDNAPMESFWGKLKQEWLNDKRFRTREDAKQAVFWYIEVYYKNYRLHESNGYKTPSERRTAA
jgi:putative transposase